MGKETFFVSKAEGENIYWYGHFFRQENKKILLFPSLINPSFTSETLVVYFLTRYSTPPHPNQSLKW